MLINYILIVLFLFSLVTFLSGNKLSKYTALFGSLISLGITGLLYITFKKNPADEGLHFSHLWLSLPKIDYLVNVTGVSLVLLLLTNFLTPFIIFTTFNKEIKNQKSFYALIVLMQFALNGYFVVDGPILFYIFWELALIPIYFIALLWGDENRKNTTLTFFLYTLFGSLFLLLALIFIQLKMSPQTELAKTILYWFIFIAFAIKIPVFPFHSWQANTYKSAPTSGTMLLSAIMLKMGFYGIYKWLIPVFGLHFHAEISKYIVVLAIIGVLWGAILAIKQNNLKKLLAYSSFSHVGMITLGMFCINAANPDLVGLKGSFVQMFAHGINIFALFYIAEIIYSRTGTYKISELGGIWKQAPLLSAFTLIVVLASISMPLTNAFVGEFMILYGIFKFNYILAIFAVLAVILGAVYMLRMYQYVFLGGTSNYSKNFKDISGQEIVILVPIIVVIFVLGLNPNFILSLLTQL